MLTDRAVLLLGIETTFRTYVPLDPTVHALLTTVPEFTTDITQLERDNARASISPEPSRNGRIVSSIKFSHEVRGRGNLDGTVAPDVGPALRACGFAQTAFPMGGAVNFWSKVGNVNRGVTLTSTGANTAPVARVLTVTCTTAGAAGAAVFSVTAPAVKLLDGNTLPTVNQTGITTSAGMAATAAALGTAISGSTLQLKLVGNAAVGDSWKVQFGPPGYLYTPVSAGFESVCGDLFYDGLRHRSTGLRGTVKQSAEAGKIAKFDFEFKGDWISPVDVPFPENAVYSEMQPPQVELADVRLDSVLTACPTKFGFDLANDVQIRECANEPQGYAGAVIVARKPKVNLDPEFGPEATYGYWSKLQIGNEVDLSYLIGTERGNSCQVIAHTQLRTLGYADRNKQRVYNVEGDAVSRAGNDELTLYFY